MSNVLVYSTPKASQRLGIGTLRWTLGLAISSVTTVQPSALAYAISSRRLWSRNRLWLLQKIEVGTVPRPSFGRTIRLLQDRRYRQKTFPPPILPPNPPGHPSLQATRLEFDRPSKDERRRGERAMPSSSLGKHQTRSR